MFGKIGGITEATTSNYRVDHIISGVIAYTYVQNYDF